MARSAPAKKGSLTPLYVILGVVAVVGIGVLLMQRRGGGSGGAATAPLDAPLDSAMIAGAPGISLGSADAPVRILEFADFQCPACGQFARFVAPLIKDPWVQNGTVQFVYHDFPITGAHPHAFLASRAGRCANEQGKFWEYHDYLYGQQSSWSASASPPVDAFVGYAEAVGMDADAFGACLRSDKYADVVTANMRLGETLGVGGTPTVIVNGKRLLDIPLTAQDVEALVRREMGSAPAPAADAAAPTDTAAAP